MWEVRSNSELEEDENNHRASQCCITEMTVSQHYIEVNDIHCYHASDCATLQIKTKMTGKKQRKLLCKERGCERENEELKKTLNIETHTFDHLAIRYCCIYILYIPCILRRRIIHCSLPQSLSFRPLDCTFFARVIQFPCLICSIWILFNFFSSSVSLSFLPFDSPYVCLSLVSFFSLCSCLFFALSDCLRCSLLPLSLLQWSNVNLNSTYSIKIQIKWHFTINIIHYMSRNYAYSVHYF